MKNDLHDLSDDTILSLITEGNHLAFNQLYNRYWKRLFSFAYNILNDKELAEDVLHEVYTYIWINKERLKVSNAKNYLFVSVRNKCISTIRKSKFTKFDEAIIDELSYHPDADKNLAFKDLKRTIDNVVNRLPRRCGAIFYLSNYHDYSNAEIAAHFNISRRTVENQLSLALKHIRKSLNKTILFISLIFPFTL